MYVCICMLMYARTSTAVLSIPKELIEQIRTSQEFSKVPFAEPARLGRLGWSFSWAKTSHMINIQI